MCSQQPAPFVLSLSKYRDDSSAGCDDRSRSAIAYSPPLRGRAINPRRRPCSWLLLAPSSRAARLFCAGLPAHAQPAPCRLSPRRDATPRRLSGCANLDAASPALSWPRHQSPSWPVLLACAGAIFSSCSPVLRRTARTRSACAVWPLAAARGDTAQVERVREVLRKTGEQLEKMAPAE